MTRFNPARPGLSNSWVSVRTSDKKWLVYYPQPLTASMYADEVAKPIAGGLEMINADPKVFEPTYFIRPGLPDELYKVYAVFYKGYKESPTHKLGMRPGASEAERQAALLAAQHLARLGNSAHVWRRDFGHYGAWALIVRPYPDPSEWDDLTAYDVLNRAGK